MNTLFVGPTWHQVRDLIMMDSPVLSTQSLTVSAQFRAFRVTRILRQRGVPAPSYAKYGPRFMELGWTGHGIPFTTTFAIASHHVVGRVDHTLTGDRKFVSIPNDLKDIADFITRHAYHHDLELDQEWDPK